MGIAKAMEVMTERFATYAELSERQDAAKVVVQEIENRLAALDARLIKLEGATSGTVTKTASPPPAGQAAG